MFHFTLNIQNHHRLPNNPNDHLHLLRKKSGENTVAQTKQLFNIYKTNVLVTCYSIKPASLLRCPATNDFLTQKLYTMKKNAFWLILLVLLGACNQNTNTPNEKMMALTNDQVIKLWDMAASKEMVGEPAISFNTVIDSATKISITQKISVQNFKLTVNIDDKGNPVPPSTDAKAVQKRAGTVFGAITCSSSCKSITIGQECTTKGCDPISGGCSAPNCGSGCFSYSCTKLSTGIGFGFVML